MHVSIPINSKNDSRSVSRSGQLLLRCPEARWEILPFPCQQVIVLFAIFWVSIIILAYLIEFQGVFLHCLACVLICYIVYRYRRYFGVIVTHQAAALFSARRNEMIDVLTLTLFYLDARSPVVVHSPFSDLPRAVMIYIKII